MVTIRYDANDMDGRWSDEGSMTDTTGATVQEVVAWICDELQTESPEDAELEVFFYDEDTMDEVASAWIDESGWQINYSPEYREE